MNKQYAMLGILFVGLIGVLVWQLMPAEDPLLTGAQTPRPAAPAAGTPPAGTSPVAPAVRPPETEQTQAEMESLLASVEEVTFEYSENRISRDPMIPLVGYINPEAAADPAAPIPPPRVSLIRSKRVTGIIYDAADPMAIVDNEIIYPGYTYPDGVVVDSISEDSVVFRHGESTITVELEER